MMRAAIFFLFVAAVVCAQTSQNTPVCGGCHAPAAKEHPISIHGSQRVSCTDCHGGDQAATTEAAGHGAGFTGKISRTAVPALCASCHSDARRMHPFGLPTDQFKLYSISKHGESVLRDGKDAAAVCTDCHGTHAIVSPKLPSAPTSREQSAKTCDKCHGDPALMTTAKLDPKIGALWREDVHGKAFEREMANAPTCTTCHGAHAASAPGAAAVVDVCGRCHEAERHAFDRSPHGDLTKVSKVRCVDCHGAHGIKEAEQLNSEAACVKCHDATTKEYAAQTKLGDARKKTATLLAEIESALVVAERDLKTSADADSVRSELRSTVAAVGTGAHSLDFAGIDAAQSRLDVLRTKAERLRHESESRVAERKFFLVPVVIAFGGLACLALILRTVAQSRRRKLAEKGTS